MNSIEDQQQQNTYEDEFLLNSNSKESLDNEDLLNDFKGKFS